MMKKGLLYLFMGILLLYSVIAPAPYNLTNLSNADNLYDSAKELNSLTNGVIIYGILLLVGFSSFVITAGNTTNPVSGLMVGSFFSWVTATIFLPLGFIGFPIWRSITIFMGLSVMLGYIVNK